VQPFYISFTIPELWPSINHSKGLVFLGSCFSDEIAEKAAYSGFQTVSNPMGTVFHPLALSKFIFDCLADHPNERLDSIQEQFISWDVSSKFCEGDRWGLLTKLYETRKSFKSTVGHSSHLFITFGTAWGYVLREDGLVVSNCHKAPMDRFSKVLTKIDEIVVDWVKLIVSLHRLFPQLTIVFTVSPVRHIRDGMVQNNQSKAILLDSVRQICAETQSLYFPSYEIVMDELRDYRFFKEDRVHPTNEAINYVWNRFIDVSCLSETRTLIDEIVAYRKLCGHKTIHTNQTESDEKMKMKLALIQSKHPQFKG
jgi:hypothetical protein